MKGLPPILRLGLIIIAVAMVILGPVFFAGRDFVPFPLHNWAPWANYHAPETLPALTAGANRDTPEKVFLVTPDLAVAKKEIAAGRLPHWNPYIRNGAPLLGHSLDGLLYPPHWLYFLLRPGLAYGFFALFSFLAAGIFTYLLLRVWDLSPLAAAGGGLFFAFSLPLCANAHFFMRQDTMALLPGLLWAFELWRQKGGARPICALALCLAGLWLAGFPPFATVFTLFLCGWIILKTPAALCRGQQLEALRLWLGAGLALGIGLLLAAPQLLPLAEYLPYSQRTLPTPDADPRIWGADPAILLTLLVPDLFGSPATLDQIEYIQSPMTYLFFCWHQDGHGLLAPFNFTENVIYAGAIPLLLAIWGISRPWPGRRRPLLLAGLAVLGLACTLDGGFISAIIPGLRSATPLRLLPVLTLILVLFAGRGLALLLARDKPPLPAIGTGLLLALGGGLAYLLVDGMTPGDYSRGLLEIFVNRFRGPGGQVYTPEYVQQVFLTPTIMAGSYEFLRTALAAMVPWWAGGATALILLRGRWHHGLPWPAIGIIALGLCDLLLQARPLCPSFPVADSFSGTYLHRALTKEKEQYAARGGVTIARLGTPGGEPDLFPPNLPTGLGVRDLQVYAFVDRHSHRPLVAALPGGENILYRNGLWIGPLPKTARQSPILDVYGITHFLHSTPEKGPVKESFTPGPGGSYKLTGPGGTTYLERRNREHGQRAWIVPKATPLNRADTLKRMAAPDFDPSMEAFVPADSPPSPPPNTTGKDPSHCEFQIDRPGMVDIKVRGTNGGLLVLTDTFAPGWQVRVDGLEKPLIRTNYCFSGVYLSPGDHQIEFSYQPRAFQLGMALLIPALAILLLLWWWQRHRPGLLHPKGD